MDNQQLPSHLASQQSQTPEQRKAHLQKQLRHIDLIAQLRDHEGFKELEATLETVVKQKRVSRDALNENDPPETFIAHKERATYLTGWIQGAEYVLLLLRASKDEEPRLTQEIANIEEEIKREKDRTNGAR